jgi:hypothetical protein
MIHHRISALVSRGASAGCTILLFTFAASILPAQAAPKAAPPISVQILDGRTGKPVTPSNILVHVDHHDAIHQDWLKLDDDGTITVTPSPTASLIALQGTYDASTMIYVNCDAAGDADTDKLHWYPIADIVAKGVVTPNKCFKGKFEQKTAVTAKPGEFIFYVRGRTVRDSSAY